MQQRAVEAARREALFAKVGFQSVINSRFGWVIAPVPEYAIRAAGPNRLTYDVIGAAARQKQVGTSLAKPMIQGRKRVMQPPAAGCSHGPKISVFFVEDVECYNRCIAVDGRRKGAIVFDSKIASEKYDTRGWPLPAHRAAPLISPASSRCSCRPARRPCSRALTTHPG